MTRRFCGALSLDLQGRIPTVAQLRDFLADERLVQAAGLCRSPADDEASPIGLPSARADHLARVWRRMMVPASSPGAGMATQLEPWLARQFAANTPYDQIRPQAAARPAAAADGRRAGATAADADAHGRSRCRRRLSSSRPSAARRRIWPAAYVRVFLGMRLNCAQCHDHPMTDWKQEDFWGIAALFNAGHADSAGEQPTPGRPTDQAAKPTKELQLHGQAAVGGGAAEGDSRRTSRRAKLLAEWLVSPENPNFAATAVNRVWQYLCGRGLAGSVDELDRVDERGAARCSTSWPSCSSSRATTSAG